MPINKLERVLWRLRKMNPGTDCHKWHDLRIAIIKECGFSPETYQRNRKALITLGWIRGKNNKKFYLTGDDLE